MLKVDAGPMIAYAILDGVLCNGGAHKQAGWQTLDQSFGSLQGAAGTPLSIDNGHVVEGRLYYHALFTSYLVGNFRAGVSPNFTRV